MWGLLTLQKLQQELTPQNTNKRKEKKNTIDQIVKQTHKSKRSDRSRRSDLISQRKLQRDPVHRHRHIPINPKYAREPR